MRFFALLRQLFIPVVTLVLAEMIFPLQSWFPFPILAIGVAVFLSLILRNRWHWHVLHALVFAGAWMASSADVAPGWYLLAVVLLALVYSGLMFTNVPLYFSGKKEVQAMLQLIQPSDVRMADLGAGIGSLVIPLAREQPGLRVDAFEIAPFPYFFGRWRGRQLKNLRWYLRPYESMHLGCYDLVFCFLSPEPMPDVWRQVLKEMRPGTRFVSNSFAVPGVEPHQVISPAGRHHLYVYRVPEAVGR